MNTTCIRIYLFIGLMFSPGCHKSPTREQAEEWYKKHKNTIDSIDRNIRQAVKEIPAFNRAFQCRPPKSDGEADKPDSHVEALKQQLKPLLHDMECTSQRGKWYEQQDQQMASFINDLLPEFLDYPGVLGVDVSYFQPNDPAWYGMGRVGNTCGGLHDRRLKDPKALDIDGRTIGWGHFQTNGTKHNGIIVSWHFLSAIKVKFVITAIVLADHTTSTEWRSLWQD